LTVILGILRHVTVAKISIPFWKLSTYNCHSRHFQMTWQAFLSDVAVSEIAIGNLKFRTFQVTW